MFVRILLCLSFLVIGLPAWAMTVTPIHVELKSTGNRNRAQVTVVNDSNAPLPVEAILMSAIFDDEGRPTTAKAGADFLIMPPQALIPPGATQNFRIQWLGNPLIEKSRSYLLYFSQVPVKQPRSRVAVQLIMSVGVLINVAPARGRPALEVVSSGFVKDVSGRRRPRITVLNRSNVHGQLRQTTIHLTDGRWAATIQPGLLERRIGIGLVQPGRRRKFTLPIDVPASVRSPRVTLETTSSR